MQTIIISNLLFSMFFAIKTLAAIPENDKPILIILKIPVFKYNLLSNL